LDSFCGFFEQAVIVDAVADPTKTELRAEILLARRTLAPEVHDAEAHALSVHLDALIDAGDTVCAYVPVGTEPGSAELLDSLVRRGVRVRLGRGAGFYDRSLPLAAPTARLVAVVRDDELVDRLPAEPHDVRMTHALTPNGGLVALG